jgi:tetratricopeptide (TPR) repeat protein
LLCRGNLSKAESALNQAIALANDSENPEVAVLSYQMLGRAYLDRGARESALASYQRAAEGCTPAMLANWRAREMYAYGLVFASVLSGLEEATVDPAAFRAFCERYPGQEQLRDGARHSPDLAQLALQQWFLEPADPSPDWGDARQLLPGQQADAPDAGSLPSGWTWHDPFGDCGYTWHEGVTIEANNGRGLWRLNQSAPRLLYALSSLPASSGAGIAVEAICAPAAADKPAIGGLVLWIDPANYLRLDRGLTGPNEITLIGCLNDRDMVLGRGRLPPEPADPGVPEQLDRAWLRFEWRAGELRALCSADGETWYTAGQAELPFESSAQFGVYASGDVDRRIYQGAYPDGAALGFETLRCWIE